MADIKDHIKIEIPDYKDFVHALTKEWKGKYFHGDFVRIS